MFSRFTRGKGPKKEENSNNGETEQSIPQEYSIGQRTEAAPTEPSQERDAQATESLYAEQPVKHGASREESGDEEVNQYAVGIDLGTTHCVLSYMPIDGGELKTLAIPQLKDLGLVADFSQLPSFLYLPHQNEFQESQIQLPWRQENAGQYVAGEFARSRGSKTPIRLVSSAKSWLGHTGVDCKEEFLPLEAPEEVEKVSPFTVTRHYLQYLLHAWEQQFPKFPLHDQALTITVPASFDPLARELTVEAAYSLGLGNAVLLEEPQAALYGWLYCQDDRWRDQLQVGDTILVVDVGGGTTDLSLINVTEVEGELVLERSAVGEHILLGGDNMDLTLAYVIKAKLENEGKKIETWQLQGLTHGCRHAKESLLLDENLSSVPIVVPNRGASLMASSLRTELTREEVVSTLVEGFFPKADIFEQPVQRRRGALTKKSLPFAQDPAISRHLAAFLASQSPPHGAGDNFAKPTVLLFNGGVFKARSLRERLLSNINAWLESASTAPAQSLQDADLDHAVANGAAYYSHVRSGHGVKIRGGTAFSYYVGIESAMPAVPGFEPPLQAYCIAPYGMEEGSRAALPEEEFGLVTGEPASFRFFRSSLRKEDVVGTLLDDWSEEELDELEEISVNLPAENGKRGEVVAVHLQAGVTEIGTLCLEAVALDQVKRWKVEFSVRDEVFAEVEP